MLSINPFAELSAWIPQGLMQAYVLLMIVAVIVGTLYDVWHKRSARYFAKLSEKSETAGERSVDAVEKRSIAIKTAMVDVATSGEFCNQRRRVAHLLTMYGFIIYIVTTLILVFGHAGPGSEPFGLVVLLWFLGALSVCVGGYWFWFFIRVDVSAEGLSPFRLVRADLFVISLIGSTTCGLIWALLQGSGVLAWLFFGLYIVATTVLFGSVAWSKFAHMFFKPAAAYQKRVANASGWAMGLPTISRDDPEQRERHSMALLRDAPVNMGLGIKREQPRHY